MSRRTNETRSLNTHTKSRRISVDFAEHTRANDGTRRQRPLRPLRERSVTRDVHAKNEERLDEKNCDFAGSRFACPNFHRTMNLELLRARKRSRARHGDAAERGVRSNVESADDDTGRRIRPTKSHVLPRRCCMEILRVTSGHGF